MSRILLLLDDRQNRRLLVNTLAQTNEIVAPEGLSSKELEKLIQQPFDLCILCRVMLKRYRQALHARKEAEYPVVLPYLLVITRKQLGIINHNSLHSIDELITIPIVKRELQVRVEVLLRSRLLSQQMHTANKKLSMEIEQIRCLETDIRSSLERERTLNELKSRFVSMVSHEFRSPLQVILSSSQIIEQHGDRLSLEKKQQFFQHIKANVKKMNQLLNDVLTIGEVDLKRFKADIKPINLSDFSRDLIEEICLTSEQHRKIAFKFYGGYNNVYVNENLIRHILINLLSNAVKYSSPENDINFTLRCQDGEVKLMSFSGDEYLTALESKLSTRLLKTTLILLYVVKMVKRFLQFKTKVLVFLAKIKKNYLVYFNVPAMPKIFPVQGWDLLL